MAGAKCKYKWDTIPIGGRFYASHPKLIGAANKRYAPKVFSGRKTKAGAWITRVA